MKPPMFIRRLMEGLAKEGHDIYLLHFGTTSILPLKKMHFISLGSNINNYQLILQSLRRSSELNYYAVFETMKKIAGGNKKILQKRNLQVILDKIQPDLIHVQWPSLLDTLGEVLNEGKYPVILSQRGYQINVKPFMDQFYCQKLATIFPKLSGFHSVSKAISIRGDSIWHSPAKIDEVIYTGLDLEEFTFRENYFRNKKLKFLSVSRPHWIKGLHDVIHACAILAKKNIDFEYVIVGGKGNEEILFLTNFYKLEKKVKILGKLPQKEVYDLMIGSDLLIVSSIEEGMPNVLVEAMALGVPVVSTACGGVEELIDNNKEGWVVPSRNPEALAAQIEKFSSLPDHSIETVRRAARSKVEKQHSYEQMLKGMESLYRKTIGRTEI